MGRDHAFLLGIALLSMARVALAHARLGLYRAHRERFRQADPRVVTAGWDQALRGGSRWAMSWVGSLALYVGLGAAVLLHPGPPRALRDAFAGCALYWILCRLCVESYYFLNRRMALASPRAASATARRFPRSGLVLELMLVFFVLLPVAAAALAERTWFLRGGAGALAAQALVAGWRVARPQRPLGPGPGEPTSG